MSLKIMVVDDEPEVLKLVKTVLEPLGYEVLTEADSRQAAERLDKQKFDGVFVDVRMPNMDGFELTKRIRTSPSNARVPIAMITGFDDVESMRQGFKAGVTFFLSKPFNPDKLRGALNAMRSVMLREKRRYARLPLRTTVSCRFGERQCKLGSVNISECGMLLESSPGLEVGQEVHLQFMIPLGREPLKPRCKVVRKEPPDRIGVQFLALEPEDREAIQGYITGRLSE